MEAVVTDIVNDVSCASALGETDRGVLTLGGYPEDWTVTLAGLRWFSGQWIEMFHDELRVSR